jgi:peptidylprolyl isomerase
MRKRTVLRTSWAVVAVAGLTLALAACTAAAPPKAPGCVSAGSASRAISVSGPYGKDPQVSATFPIKAPRSTQRSVVSAGTGAVVRRGDRVDLDFEMYNGTSGKVLTSTRFEGQPVTFTLTKASKVLGGIIDTVACSRVGSRVVGVIPPTDAFGKAGSTKLGVGAADSLVLIADVVSIVPAPPAPLSTPSGIEQSPLPGFPTVSLGRKGVPVVSIPAAPAPAEFEAETLILGQGAKVHADVNVIVNYQALNWRTGKIVDGRDTWLTGHTAIFNTGVSIPGFARAVEGQPVGSRVLVVIPPSLGYKAAGQPTLGIRGSDDLVFLIDILGTD